MKPGLIVLTIYNTAAGEICRSDRPFFVFLQNSLFDLIARVLDFATNSHGFFNDSEIRQNFQKITSRNPICFVARVDGKLRRRVFCRTSALVLTKNNRVLIYFYLSTAKGARV